jgi:hypothetical protein
VDNIYEARGPRPERRDLASKEREPMHGLSRTTKSTFLGLALGLLLWGTAAQAGNPGESGVLSLRLGVGAREAAMGDAGVASSRGASALFWNPANNVFADFETELVLQHYRHFGVASQEAAAIAHRAGPGVLGFIFSGLYWDSIDRYGEEGVGVPEGTFKPYDVSFGLSYALPLGHRFGVGMTAKMVYEKIDLYSDTGYAFDFFITHKAMIEGLVFAASATNMGSDMNLYVEAFPLPTAYRLGAAYTPVAEGLLGRLTLAGDISFPNDTQNKGHFGAELELLPELVLRGGTRVNYDSQGWTAGAGFKPLRNLVVDYAYQNSKTEGFDDGHKFSLTATW